MSPAIVDVGLVPSIAYFAVTEKRPCEPDFPWELRIHHFGVDVTDDYRAAAFDPDYLTNRDTAPVSVDIRMNEPDSAPEQVILPYGFRLRRGTELTAFHVSPKAAAPGDLVTLTARLLRADWDTQQYEPYAASGRVHILWAIRTDGTWLHKKTAEIASDGSIKTQVRVPDTSDRKWYWRLIFRGDPNGGASISGIRTTTRSG